MRINSSRLQKLVTSSLDMAARLHDELGEDWVALEFESEVLDNKLLVSPWWNFVRKEEVEWDT